MDDSGTDPERVVDTVDAGKVERAGALLEQYRTAPDDERAAVIRALGEAPPSALEPLLPTLADFLTDPERPVRLSTAKLFVTVAREAPDSARSVVDPLAARLADDEEFYYVRARAAEALGYVALEYPDDVATPETVAELSLGLEFDEPEVTEKLAKAIECVALGNPERLDTQVERLADHLDDENELVRYHLCTALAVVGCASPTALADATDALEARLGDLNPHVRGRAAEALGVVADAEVGYSPPAKALEPLWTADEPFVAIRAAYALGMDKEVGTVASVRESTEAAVEAITEPDGDACPACGAPMPGDGPPMCPQCGAPR